jgi:hypothetical protein
MAALPSLPRINLDERQLLPLAQAQPDERVGPQMTHAAHRSEEASPARRLGLVLQEFEIVGAVGLGEAHEQLAAGDAVLDEGGAGFMGGVGAAERLSP